jgi:hypothetical protein
MDSLRQFGSTEAVDLTKEVARQLGFKRTGDRIKQKIGECVESLILEGKIGREDGRLQAAAPGPTSPDAPRGPERIEPASAGDQPVPPQEVV